MAAAMAELGATVHLHQADAARVPRGRRRDRPAYRLPLSGYVGGMTTADGSDHLADLDLAPNEASGLLRVRDQALLDHFGLDLAFWSVLDEVDVAECIVLVGHRSGEPLNDGWSPQRLRAERRGSGGSAKDAEAVTFWDGHVYVVGSHHGGKDGPIRREEQWVARFDESAVVHDEAAGIPGATLVVVDTAFRLHRLLNDALRHCGIDLVPMTDLLRRSFVEASMDELRGGQEEGLVRQDDWTVNLEGAEFTPSGDMLLGLRFPVAADGRPLVVELAQWAGLFDQPLQLPEVTAVRALPAVGRNGSMAGVRDLCVVGDTLHVVTGDLDSAGKGSVIREDLPAGNETVSTHFAMDLPSAEEPSPHARVIKEFPDHPRIEGLAADAEGRFFYVSDEDEAIVMRTTPLITTAP